MRQLPLQSEIFDVAVVGGGIVGCGVARDAALRGLRVVLFEKHDFGSGTTSTSTRIVHGGLRYLETADFRLVRLDLRERETLLRIAPHLVRPLEFVIPFDGLSRWQQARVRVGLTLYDALAFGSSLPRHRSRRTEAAYFDARADSPERLCIENVVDAALRGARPLNYVEVLGAIRQGQAVTGVRVRDRLSGEEAEVRARVTVNAGGPWFDRVARALGDQAPARIRTTKGVHVVCAAPSDRAMVVFSPVDGRLLFAIPRLGLTWFGTTDTDFSGDPAEAAATREDVEYVLESVRGHFPGLRVEDVLFTTAGVRALVMQRGRASSVSRMHRIVDGEAAAVPGLVSILGGKITGYRAIAEEAVDAVCRQLRRPERSTTASTPLPGARGARPPDVTQHLYDLYGSRAGEIAQLAAARPELARPLAPAYPDIAAQVVFAVREEFCVTVSDFLRRRTLLSVTADQGRQAVSAVAAVMAAECGWTNETRAREIESYAHEVERSQAFRNRGGDSPRPADRGR